MLLLAEGASSRNLVSDLNLIVCERLIMMQPQDNFISSQDHGIANVKAYNHKGPKNWTSNKDGVSRRQLFDLATYAPGEIVKEIHVR